MILVIIQMADKNNCIPAHLCQKVIFRLLLCGNSGSGKTNLLCHILQSPLVYYDQIHLYAKTLDQEK